MVEAATPSGWHALLDDALAGVGVRTVFQPVIDLARRCVAGYEALTRFDTRNGCVATPDLWFGAAHECGVGPELEAVALRNAFAFRHSLPPSCFLSVNVDPDHLASELVLDVLREQRDLRGVVVEFTEHRTSDLGRLAPRIDWLRDAGALIAIDDAGSGHSGLKQVLQLRPSIIKLDRGLVSDIDRDEAKAALVEMVGVFANRVDAWIIAEGIETMGEAARLIDLDVPLAQGFLFGRPAPPWEPIDPLVAARLPRTDTHEPASIVHLVDVLPTVSAHELPAGKPLLPHAEWTVVVDERRLPLGVVAAGSAAITPTLKVKSDSSAVEVAQRVCAAVPEPVLPVVVIDESGRYVGAVTVRRLLGELAHCLLANSDDTAPAAAEEHPLH